MIYIGNNTISSAIWSQFQFSFNQNQLAQINFSKTCQEMGEYNLWSLKKLQVLIYSKLKEKNHVITS